MHHHRNSHVWSLFWVRKNVSHDDRNLGENWQSKNQRHWSFSMLDMFFFAVNLLRNYCTIQGINISHLGKRKTIFKIGFSGDMLVPRRVYTPWKLFTSEFLLLNIYTKRAFKKEAKLDVVFQLSSPKRTVRT